MDKQEGKFSLWDLLLFTARGIGLHYGANVENIRGSTLHKSFGPQYYCFCPYYSDNVILLCNATIHL